MSLLWTYETTPKCNVPGGPRRRHLVSFDLFVWLLERATRWPPTCVTVGEDIDESTELLMSESSLSLLCLMPWRRSSLRLTADNWCCKSRTCFWSCSFVGWSVAGWSVPRQWQICLENVILDTIFILQWIHFNSLWIVFWNYSRRFGFSSRSLGHVMFSFAGTAQEAGAGGRSVAVGIPVRSSLMGRFSLCKQLLSFFCSSRERKHYVAKTSRWEAETSWRISKYDPKWVNMYSQQICLFHLSYNFFTNETCIQNKSWNWYIWR